MTSTVAVYVDDCGAAFEHAEAGAGVAPPIARMAWDEGRPVQLPRSAEELLCVAVQIGSRLRQDFPGGVTARLAIPAHWCFCEVVYVEGSVPSEDAVAYEFEDHIPVELERLTWAVQKIHASSAMVAAVFTEPIKAFLAKLEEYGVAVELLTVDAALLVSSEEARDDAGEITTLSSDAHTTLICRSRDGRGCVRSFRGATGTKDFETHVSLTLAHAGGGAHRLLTCDVSSQRTAGGEVVGEGVLRALLSARDPLDLRRGELAFAGRWEPVRSKLRRCAAVVVVLLFVLAARFYWAKTACARASSEVSSVQAQIYQSVFPSTALPSGAALRVRSERIRLAGLTRTGEVRGESPVHHDLETFDLLHQLTASIPPHVRLHVNEIEIDAEGIRVAGQAAAHAAAGEWVQEINRSASLRADPPRTNLRKDGTVDFRIFARKEVAGEP